MWQRHPAAVHKDAKRQDAASTILSTGGLAFRENERSRGRGEAPCGIADGVARDATMGSLANLDGEALAMMNLAVPVQLAVHVAEVVADAVDFSADAITVKVAVGSFIFDVLWVFAEAF